MQRPRLPPLLAHFKGNAALPPLHPFWSQRPPSLVFARVASVRGKAKGEIFLSKLTAIKATEGSKKDFTFTANGVSSRSRKKERNTCRKLARFRTGFHS